MPTTLTSGARRSALIALVATSFLAACGDFNITAIDPAGQGGGTPNLMFSLDKASGQNGEKIALTITVVAADPSGVSPFYVRAELNGTRMSWLGVVGQLDRIRKRAIGLQAAGYGQRESGLFSGPFLADACSLTTSISG